MRYYQMPLIEIDQLIKLGEVERILSQVFFPAPSRPTIVGWIEDGTLVSYCVTERITVPGKRPLDATEIDSWLALSPPLLG